MSGYQGDTFEESGTQVCYSIEHVSMTKPVETQENEAQKTLLYTKYYGNITAFFWGVKKVVYRS